MTRSADGRTRPASGSASAGPASAASTTAATSRTDDAAAEASRRRRERALTIGGLLTYLAIGTAFGFVLTKAEAISWFRIQEMFRFQSFHMYGIFATAVPVAAVSLALIRRFDIRTRDGKSVDVPPKVMGRGYRYVFGGLCFGFGWALTGACPGPLFALVGSGVGPVAFAIACAVAGTWVYGRVRGRLPHY